MISSNLNAFGYVWAYLIMHDYDMNMCKWNYDCWI